jgi:hypothetical protein
VRALERLSHRVRRRAQLDAFAQRVARERRHRARDADARAVNRDVRDEGAPRRPPARARGVARRHRATTPWFDAVTSTPRDNATRRDDDGRDG